jgi:hypothetical protein
MPPGRANRLPPYQPVGSGRRTYRAQSSEMLRSFAAWTMNFVPSLRHCADQPSRSAKPPPQRPARLENKRPNAARTQSTWIAAITTPARLTNVAPFGHPRQLTPDRLRNPNRTSGAAGQPLTSGTRTARPNRLPAAKRRSRRLSGCVQSRLSAFHLRASARGFSFVPNSSMRARSHPPRLGTQHRTT